MKVKSAKGVAAVDEYNHGRMLEAITGLTSKNKRYAAPQRTETVPVSEFTQKFNEPVAVTNLLNALGTTGNLTDVRYEVKKSLHSDFKVLNVPLEKPVVTKLNRVVAYEKVSNEVTKWEKVVFQNRAADQLVFPLNQPSVRMQTNAEVVKRFQLTTPLEMEVRALLNEEIPIIQETAEDQEMAITQRTLEDVEEMRNEMRKIRARMTYEEAKARYQKKIKSKRYHRILKKERMKKEVKDFETLQKDNPEWAQAKLERIDRERILERMTLRHRNTGKWAREQILKFKDSKESGRAIQDQILLSRQLTSKAYIPSDSDDEVDDRNEAKTESSSKGLQLSFNDPSNPWMNSFSRFTSRNVPESVKNNVDSKLLVGYRKFWEEENQRRQSEPSEQMNEAETDTDEEKSNHVALMKQRKVQSQKKANGKEDIADKVKPKDTVLNKKLKKKQSEKKRKTINDETQEGTGSVKKPKKTSVEKVVSETKAKIKKANREDARKKPTGDDDEKQSKKRELNPIAKINEMFKNSAKKKKEKLMRKKLKGDDEHVKPNIKVPDTSKNSKKTEAEDENREDEEEEGDVIDETLIRKRLWKDFDHFEPETNKKPKRGNTSKSYEKKKERVVAPKEQTEDDVAVNPNDFIAVKGKVIKCHIPEEAYEDDDAVDDEYEGQQSVNNRMTIAEAFADDDVIDEFVAEKQAVIDKDKPKDIDLTLPGWGEWGGIGVQVSEWKKKKFTYKPPPGPPRRDRGLSHVIINEQADEIVKKFQVVDVPRHYLTPQAFEKSIAAPIGKHWNPETAFNRLIAPKVVTKLGAIIEPIDDSFLETTEEIPTDICLRNN